MKKIPEPLYSCKYCADEYSWPAKDLHWSEKSQDWVCRECWSYSEECEQGISLADEIKAQATEPKRGETMKNPTKINEMIEHRTEQIKNFYS
jgi:hypothetical protein